MHKLHLSTKQKGKSLNHRDWGSETSLHAKFGECDNWRLCGWILSWPAKTRKMANEFRDFHSEICHVNFKISTGHILSNERGLRSTRFRIMNNLIALMNLNWESYHTPWLEEINPLSRLNYGISKRPMLNSEWLEETVSLLRIDHLISAYAI